MWQIYFGTTVTKSNCIHEETKSRKFGLLYPAVCYLETYRLKLCKTILLRFVLYAWTVVSHVKEKHLLRVSENRVLRRVFGPKREDVTGGWRKLHIDELHSLYSSPNAIMFIKSRKICGWCSPHEGTKCINILVGKREGKRPLGRPGHKWENTIKIDLR